MAERPQFLTRLASSGDADVRERAWTAFLTEFSPLLMHAARALGTNHDDVMDRYAYVVERLRRDDYRKLLSFLTEGRGRFETWLTFVCRNLCLDAYRQRYGRLQSESVDAQHARAARRRLADLVAVEIDNVVVPNPAENAELGIRSAELHQALESALNALEVHERLLLKLRFENGLSVPQIARATGHRNAFEVYRKLDKIFAQLRTTLRAAGVDSAAP